MSYSAIVFKVMIASPSDVAVERNIIRDVLTEWNIINSDTRKIVLLPVGWETHSTPEMGNRPQAIINKQILKDCDLLVGVFWTRIGTATGEYASGTIEEIEEHIKANKPVMLYFSNAPVHPDSVDQEQYSKLKEFQESCKDRGIYETYDNINDFKEKFSRQLQRKINQDEYFTSENNINFDKTIETSIPNVPHLSKESQTLLKEASNDISGTILRLAYIGGISIQTNGQQFVEGDNPREQAMWEGAIDELESEGLIQAQGYKRESFRITREGYEVADLINP